MANRPFNVPFQKLGRTVQNINRIREVIRVLVSHGFEDIVANSPLRRFVPRQQQLNWTRQEKPVLEFTRYERLRLVIEELGPTFIKLGQMISNRPELLPEGLLREFEKLHDRVPPFDAETARLIVERETGKSIQELFVYFDDIPIGSASIGQVHRARLHSGKDVVVKVQRPGVRTKVRTDLSLIKDVVRLLEGTLRKSGILNPMDIVEVFEEMMLNELDYQNERRNILYFRKLYASKKGFYVPEVLEANASSRVLIIEFISGCKITDLPQLKAWGLDTKVIAEQCLQSYLLQIFDYGYFHADPHPGNLLVRPNGTIVLIDFGMVGRLNRQDKYALAGMFNSLAQQDARGLAMNIRRLSLDSDIEDMKMFEIDLNDLIEDLVIYGETSEGMSLITRRLQSLIYQYDLKVPGSVYMILRALVILEGNSAMLSPDIHLFEYLKPYGFKILREQFSPQNVTLDLFYTAQQVTSLLYHFPTELRSIIRKVRKGQLNLNVYLKGIEPLFSKLDRAANKVAGALVTSALLISSAITMTATYPPNFPRLLGFPIISFIGFVLSGLYGTFLLYYLIKKRS